MSDYQFDTDYLEVGDTFEGSPMEQGYFLSAVMAVGGEVEIKGNKVVITQLPKKEVSKTKAPDSPKAEAPKTEAPKVVQPPKEAPKVEAPKVETPKVETPKVEAPKVDHAPYVKTAPKTKTPSIQDKTKE